MFDGFSVCMLYMVYQIPLSICQNIYIFKPYGKHGKKIVQPISRNAKKRIISINNKKTKMNVHLSTSK